MTLTAATLRGTYPAIVTPFNADGSAVDFESLTALIEHLIGAGVQGLVVCGSTGEASTLTDAEYEAVVRHTLAITKQRVPCIAGVGGSSTARARIAAEFARSAGCEGLLVVAPPYNKPSQEGIIAHFREIHTAAGGLPIIAYNVPGRTVVSILPPTIQRLAREGLIIGVKDATGSLDYALDILSGIQGSASTADFSLLSGEDSLVLPILSIGGRGVISASANVAAKGFVELNEAFARGDIAAARSAQFRLLPIVRACFIETNPVPVKAGLKILGIIEHRTVRLPLMAAHEATVGIMQTVLARPAGA